MHLAVIAYPQLVEGAKEWIEDLRRQYDGLQCDPIPPYINMVFPLATIEQARLIDHVRFVAERFQPIHFMVRCAIPMKDHLSPATYIFLPPDEGFSGMVFLHDALHTGPLMHHLNKDSTYVPHVSVGYCDDVLYARQIVDEINGVPFEMEGLLDTLDVVVIEEGIQSVARISL